MKNLLISLLVFNYGLTFSQSQINPRQDSDTLFVYFKNSKKEIVKGPRLFSAPNIMEKIYSFDFDRPVHYYEFVSYTHRRTKDGFVEMPIIEMSNKFLRKNKKRMLTYCRQKKMNLKEIEEFYWKNKNRPIYLIDKKESKKGKVFLRRVSFYSAYQIEQ